MSFIPENTVLITYLIGVLIITFTPGPDMTFFLGKTISQGVAFGMTAMLGATFGLLIHSALVAFGLSALIVASPFLFFGLKLLGALYLLWLAFEAIRKGSSFSFDDEDKKKRSLVQTFLQGVGINMLNPKIILFFMTFMPQFISADDPHASGKLLFLGGLFVVVGAGCATIIIFAAGRLTGWLKKNPKVMRIIDYLFASVFGAFAVRILLTERG